LAAAGLDGTRFRHVMATIGVSGELLKHRLETLSAGELKKIELARTLLEPADVLIWDEPLNYIDVESRLQIEALILDVEPTLIFVEHDRYFIEQVATDVLALAPLLP
jgi:lincosamide and streptogramin A transport system ATP-binding/permease protein